MRFRCSAAATAATALLLGATPAANAALQAPDAQDAASAAGTPACVTPPPVRVSTTVHCYRPADITAHYGVDALHRDGTLGQGQTIVLVDSYGTPTGREDLQRFHDEFYPGLPDPNYSEDHPLGTPDYNADAHGNGNSGPAAAAGWAGEATLDIEWAYAIAPLAHIVLLSVPPAETLGVQGFPNLFKAMSAAIDKYPPGTVFSQSFGVTEETFGGAAATQTARFDAVYRKAAAKGDTMLASSGDNGTLNVSKRHRESVTYDHPTVGWPASSPWVTAVGGTQLQRGWTWNPTSDVPFTADGAYNPAYFGWTDGGDRDVVWNESWLPAATGGGPSAIYPRPSYQDPVAGIVGDHRGVPDLAWNAAVNGGVLVYTSFFPGVSRVGWHTYGGTSAGSPQVAGLVALANQVQAAKGGKPLGFLNPLIYAPGSATGFTDVLPAHQGTVSSGELVDNGMFDYVGDGEPVRKDAVPGWPVTPGYDMTTGFGTPQASGFVAALGAARDAAG